jgi:hypothetical protein
MTLFPRFSTLTPLEWATVIWFFASLLYLLWLTPGMRRRKPPMWLRVACVLNFLAATAVYRGILQ